MSRRIFAATALLLLTAQDAAAQESADTFRLSEIVVTATRVPVPRAAAPAAVTVITREELRSRGVVYLADALREVPGAAVVQTGPVGGLTALFLRGGEADYVKVLVDGVPLNAPGGAFDFGELTTDDVDRIEIVRGPTSVLYGSDAVAGVVQIFTRRGAGGPRMDAAARAGSQATADFDATVQAGGSRASFSAGAAHHRTDGVYAFNNQFRGTVVSAGARLAPVQRLESDVTLRYNDSEYHYPTEGTGEPVDRNAFQRTKRLVAAAELGYRATDRVALRLLLTGNAADITIDDRPDDAADTLGFFGYNSEQELRRTGADLRADVRLPMGTILSTGGAYERQREQSASQSRSEFGEFPGEFDAARNNRALYAQAHAAPGAAAAVTAGVRHEENETFGGHTTWRLGASSEVLSRTRVRVAIGTAFKEPTFFENFAEGIARGNPDLRPERSRSWEVGAERGFAAGALRLEATYFAQRFRDMIQYTFTTPTPEAPNYYNVAAARADGVELAAAAQRGAASLRAAYTYLDSEALETGFQEGEHAEFVEGGRLLRRPVHSGSIGVTLRALPRTTLGVTAHLAGERDDLDFSAFPAERVKLPAYRRIDVSAQVALLGAAGRRPALALTARAENLLDAAYQEIAGFDARGRTLLVGLRTQR